jgi:protein-disulfide isomerase
MALGELMDVVTRHWSFDDHSYPGLAQLSDAQRRAFALRHILMHQQKAAGRLAEVCEPVDHGAPLDEGKLRLATRNFFINTLRLAAAAGMTAEDLTAVVHDWAAQKHVP